MSVPCSPNTSPAWNLQCISAPVAEALWGPCRYVRDILFYLVATLLAFIIFQNGHIHVWEAAGLVFYYIVFVVYVVRSPPPPPLPSRPHPTHPNPPAEASWLPNLPEPLTRALQFRISPSPCSCTLGSARSATPLPCPCFPLLPPLEHSLGPAVDASAHMHVHVALMAAVIAPGLEG